MPKHTTLERPLKCLGKLFIMVINLYILSAKQMAEHSPSFTFKVKGTMQIYVDGKFVCERSLSPLSLPDKNYSSSYSCPEKKDQETDGDDWWWGTDLDEDEI